MLNIRENSQECPSDRKIQIGRGGKIEIKQIFGELDKEICNVCAQSEFERLFVTVDSVLNCNKVLYKGNRSLLRQETG